MQNAKLCSLSYDTHVSYKKVIPACWTEPLHSALLIEEKKVQFQKWDAKINFLLKKIYIHHSGHDLTSILQFFSDFLVRTV